MCIGMYAYISIYDLKPTHGCNAHVGFQARLTPGRVYVCMYVCIYIYIYIHA